MEIYIYNIGKILSTKKNNNHNHKITVTAGTMTNWHAPVVFQGSSTSSSLYPWLFKYLNISINIRNTRASHGTETFLR